MGALAGPSSITKIECPSMFCGLPRDCQTLGLMDLGVVSDIIKSFE
jgi:hypothetical protein